MLKLIIPLLIFILVACAPRGEHKSVDELLSKAKKRYVENYNESLTVAQQLKDLTNTLESILEGKTENLSQAKQASDLLFELNKKAGYTSRPAISELVLQYQAIARSHAGENANFSSVKLLVSRTYNLLASELESTAFGL